MASRSVLKHTMTMYFRDSAEKNAFMARLTHVRQLLTPPGASLLSYQDVVFSMLETVAGEAKETAAAEATSMNRNNGKLGRGLSMLC